MLIGSSMHVAAAAYFIIAVAIGPELLGAFGGICRAAATKQSCNRITLHTSDSCQHQNVAAKALASSCSNGFQYA